MKLSSLPALVCGLVSLAGALVAHAQVQYDFRLNITPLIGNAAGPFYLDFQLNDGSGVGNGNNTAIVSGFAFHGGGPLADLGRIGNATGSLATAVTLRDTAFLNEFFQAFTPGTSLEFRLTLTSNVDVPSPDLFAFSILDENLNALPTFSNTDAFALINLAGQTTPQSFAGNGAVVGGIAIGAAAITAVPEPSSYGAIGAATLVALVVWGRRRRAGRAAVAAAV